MLCRRGAFGKVAKFIYPFEKIVNVLKRFKDFFLDDVLTKAAVSSVNRTAGNVQIPDA